MIFIRSPSKLKLLLQTNQLWWNYSQKYASTLRDVVLDSVNRILACGQVIMGYATWLCSNEQCSHSKKICMGCKSRMCNTCGKKLTDQWIEKQKALLPVPLHLAQTDDRSHPPDTIRLRGSRNTPNR